MRKFLLLLLVLCPTLSIAQETRGTILGRVTDATGSVVPNAEVRAVNADTGVAITGRTNASGNYTLPYLPPGPYSVTAELTGFRKFVREGIEIRLNDTVEVNIELTPGNVTESVQVT